MQRQSEVTTAGVLDRRNQAPSGTRHESSIPGCRYRLGYLDGAALDAARNE